MSMDVIVAEFELKNGEAVICKHCKVTVKGVDVALVQVINEWIVSFFCSPRCQEANLGKQS